MNYYEHHLGDYMRDTAHLSMLEDGAYRRLMDVYYTREQPLPTALKDCCRLARAQSKPEREAVDAVLKEFFHQSPEGWRHKRCDEEIARYQEKKPSADAKKENDRERQKRARERRKQLFDELRSHGITAPWDATTEQLQDALSRVTDNASHAQVTHPVTRDNTATQTPDTRHHISTNQSTSDELVGEAPTESPAERLIADRTVQIAILLRNLNVKPFTAMHPQAIEWASNPKVTDDILKAAVDSARQYKPNDSHISPAYIKPIVEQLITPQACQRQAPEKPWHESASGIEAKAKEFGIEQGSREAYPEFRDRVYAEARKKGEEIPWPKR